MKTQKNLINLQQNFYRRTKGEPKLNETEIKQLEMENEYLKKLNALVQAKGKSPKKTK